MGLDPVVVSTLLGAVVGGVASVGGGMWVASREGRSRTEDRRRILGELFLAARKELMIDMARARNAEAQGVWYPLQHTVLGNLLGSPEGLASDPLVQAEATISAYNALVELVYSQADNVTKTKAHGLLQQMVGTVDEELRKAVETIDRLRNDRGLVGRSERQR